MFSQNIYDSNIYTPPPRRLVVNGENSLVSLWNWTCPFITTKLHPIANYDTDILIKKGMPCGRVIIEEAVSSENKSAV